MSLRQKGKDEKRERIFRAATALFSSKGYEQTTIREIAKQAEVGTGTVFLYAEDKQALLATIFCTEVAEVGRRAAPLLDGSEPIEDRMCAFFGEYYTYYGRHEELSRVFLKELMFSSRRLPELRSATGAFLGMVTEALVRAQSEGAVRSDVETGRGAALLFSAYWTCLTAWLGGALPSADAARTELRQALHVLFRGLAAEQASPA